MRLNSFLIHVITFYNKFDVHYPHQHILRAPRVGGGALWLSVCLFNKIKEKEESAIKCNVLSAGASRS